VAFNHFGSLNSFWTTFSDNSSSAGLGPPVNLANVSTRAEILGFITNNPGSYLRDVSEEMGLAIGDVQYHLWILIKNGEIIDRRDGRYRRFFESGKYSEMEQKVISALRQDTAGRILIRLAGEQSVSHMQLANMLGLTSQAVTWQMGRLRLTGLVEVVPGSEGKSYRLADCASEFVDRYAKAGETRASSGAQRQTMAPGITSVESPFTRALFWSF
jgi:DNA-binding MarR family transcriptional regulator